MPSGVRSNGDTPVPPEVTMKRAPDSIASCTASCTLAMPSGTIVASPTWNPASTSIATARGPEVSSRSPRELRFETVMTAADAPGVFSSAIPIPYAKQ